MKEYFTYFSFLFSSKLNFIDLVVGVLSRVLETLLSQADTDLLFTQLFFLRSSSR